MRKKSLKGAKVEAISDFSVSTLIGDCVISSPTILFRRSEKNVKNLALDFPSHFLIVNQSVEKDIFVIKLCRDHLTCYICSGPNVPVLDISILEESVFEYYIMKVCSICMYYTYTT